MRPLFHDNEPEKEKLVSKTSVFVLGKSLFFIPVNVKISRSNHAIFQAGYCWWGFAVNTLLHKNTFFFLVIVVCLTRVF